MNFYESNIRLDRNSIQSLKEIIDNSKIGCTLFESEYLSTQECLSHPYYKDFIGGLNNDSPIAFILFKINNQDNSLHFFKNKDYLLNLMSNFSQYLFIFNSNINIEKKDIYLNSGELSHIYFYEQQYFEENRNIDVSIYHEDIDNQCRILLSLPRFTVYDNSNWNTIIDYDWTLVNKIIIKRIKGIPCSDSQII